MKNILYYAIISIASAAAALGVEIKCGGFTPDTIRPEDTARYTVILRDVGGSIDPRAIPMPSGLRIVGTNTSRKFSMTNGRTSSQTELVFTVEASREGEFTVPEWSIEHDGKKYAIAPAKLTVDKNAKPAQTRQSFFDDEDDIFGAFPSMFRQMRNAQHAQMQRIRQAQQDRRESLGALSKHISLKLEMPKGKIYAGQALPCKLVFEYSKALAAEGFKLAKLFPQTSKSDAFDCSMAEDKFTTKTDGADSVKISYEVLLTPLKAGTYPLDFNAQGVFLQESDADPFFAGFGAMNQVPFKTSTADMKIEVLPLPEEGKPAEFSGAIGKFSVSNAKVENDALTAGEPCIISLDVVGMGNFARVSAPVMAASKQWKTYKPKSSFADEGNSMGYIGIKNFKYTAGPTVADVPATPAFKFAFFDPESGEYKNIEVAGAPVSVAPSQTGAAQKAPDRPKKNPDAADFDSVKETKAKSGDSRLLDSPLFWGVQIAVLAVLALLATLRIKTLKLRNNPALAKKMRDAKNARKFLSQAKDAADKSDIKTFAECARKAVQCALAANSQECESPSITSAQAAAMSAKMQLPPHDAEAVSKFFALADEISFGALSPEKTDLRELYADLKSAVSRMI